MDQDAMSNWMHSVTHDDRVSLMSGNMHRLTYYLAADFGCTLQDLDRAAREAGWVGIFKDANFVLIGATMERTEAVCPPNAAMFEDKRELSYELQ